MATVIAPPPDEGPKVRNERPPYESPRSNRPERGDYLEKSPFSKDIYFLKKCMQIVGDVERAVVPPHSSVLHKKYAELNALIQSDEFRQGTYECTWLSEVLEAHECSKARRRIPGAPSVMQLRGTGVFWSNLWNQLQRRCAEKALCLVREVQAIDNRDRNKKKEVLTRLAAIIPLYAEIEYGFMKNGFDAHNKVFVREPDLEAASKLLQAHGAPLESIPLPVRPRVRGMRMEFIKV